MEHLDLGNSGDSKFLDFGKLNYKEVGVLSPDFHILTGFYYMLTSANFTPLLESDSEWETYEFIHLVSYFL